MKNLATSISVLFKFIAKNPPMALILGGILFILVSVITPGIDQATTVYLRDMATWLFIGGVLLQVFWLIMRRGH